MWRMPYPLVSTIGALAIALLAASPSIAQDFVPEASALDETFDRIGWTGSIDFGANFSLSSNNRVVGQTDGVSLSIGNALSGRLTYTHEHHQVRNTLRNSQTFSRTPLVRELVKTADDFRVESIYYYRVPSVPWFGPFARFQLNTALFRGFDVQPDVVTYRIAPEEEGGDFTEVVDDRLRLTEAFAPLTLRESAGLFARPVEEERVTTDFRLGGGARQVFADGQLSIRDNEDTPEIDVIRLRTYNQIGAEVAAEVGGSFEEGRVRYGLEAEALFPFYNSIESEERSVLELTNVEFLATLSFRLVDWASLSYELRVQRIPQLVDDWQVSNNLLFTVGFGRTFGVEDEEG